MATFAFTRDIPESKVPSVVIKSHKTAYPKAQHVEWEKRGANYEAEFKIGKEEFKTLYSAGGKKLIEKKDVPNANLPAAIRFTIQKNYSGFVVDDVDSVVRDGKTFYQVELDARMKPDKKLVFTTNGKLANNIKYWD